MNYDLLGSIKVKSRSEVRDGFLTDCNYFNLATWRLV